MSGPTEEMHIPPYNMAQAINLLVQVYEDLQDAIYNHLEGKSSKEWLDAYRVTLDEILKKNMRRLSK